MSDMSFQIHVTEVRLTRVAALDGEDEKHLRRLCSMGQYLKIGEYNGKNRGCNSDFLWMEQKYGRTSVWEQKEESVAGESEEA